MELLELDICYANNTLSTASLSKLEILSSYEFLILVLGAILLILFRVINIRKKMRRRRRRRTPTVRVVFERFRNIRTYSHIKSESCGPVLCLEHQSKDPEHLNADDLQKLAKNQPVQQESVSDYHFGGYMPVTIGENLGRRFEVIRKLGFGHFSTVWLCKDVRRRPKDKYVAVKVVKSAPIYAHVATDEIRLLQHVVQGDRTHVGAQRIILMLEHFRERSVNGTHHCLSFELMGPSLLNLLTQSDFKGIHLPGVKIITKQILEGLDYLHNVCKVIHTDLKPENVLITIKDSYVRHLVETKHRYVEMGVQFPKSYVTSECWESYDYTGGGDEGERPSGSSELVKFGRANSYPTESDSNIEYSRHDRTKLKKPMWISPNIQVKIADLGNACWEDHPYSSNIQTKQYRALEVLLRAGYSYPADIWSLGCLAFELATGEYLFNPKDTQYCSASEDHILLIFELLGGIPPYIAQRGRRSHNFFDSTGKLIIIEDSKLRLWNAENVLLEKYNWKRVNAIPFANILEQMIEPDPELRITANAALQSEWLNDVSS